ncbi:galectin-related protein-like [Bufo bufo]|uniref:galectin-related protein-like n=1 Tax=Bufo bufo TaxID=8384 RepID=UPI001ABEE604|nr:galectin-related protein-like [Bufo bufo]
MAASSNKRATVPEISLSFIWGSIDHCSSVHSFTVSLLCSPEDAEEDVALLLTVNFQDRSIIRNAKFAGIWGTEEKQIPYFPFTPGNNFKMEILCEHQQMRVLLDGQGLCDFTHRVPQLKAVTGLRVTGDIKLTKVA